MSAALKSVSLHVISQFRVYFCIGQQKSNFQIILLLPNLGVHCTLNFYKYEIVSPCDEEIWEKKFPGVFTEERNIFQIQYKIQH